MYILLETFFFYSPTHKEVKKRQECIINVCLYRTLTLLHKFAKITRL